MKKLLVVLVALACAQLAAAAYRTCHRQVIPAAASTEGADGSSWRTDLEVFNASQQDALITIELVPSGFEGAGQLADSVVLPAPLGPGQSDLVRHVQHL